MTEMTSIARTDTPALVALRRLAHSGRAHVRRGALTLAGVARPAWLAMAGDGRALAAALIGEGAALGREVDGGG